MVHGKGDSSVWSEQSLESCGFFEHIEKHNFTSMTSHQVVASLSKESQNKREINHVPPNSIPHLCQSFVVQDYAKDDGIGEGMGSLWEESDVAPKKMTQTPGIRDAKPMERVLNYTSTLLFISHST